MGGLDASVGIAENYRRFAQRDVVARSSAYQELALAVARDGTVLDFLATLPAGKQQPNLLFAAARLILGDTPGEQSLRHLVDQRTDELATVMRRRRTQTNEVGRCATLLPALSRLPQPLALIEVGASAGLTLLPDRYSYDYDGHLVRGTDPSAPTLTCHVTGPVPLPDAVPSILWRAGLDLNPLDVASDDDVAWLECLVWPGQPERRDRLRRAAASARRDPPPVHRGDLIDDLPALVARVPTEAATTWCFIRRYWPISSRPGGRRSRILWRTWGFIGCRMRRLVSCRSPATRAAKAFGWSRTVVTWSRIPTRTARRCTGWTSLSGAPRRGYDARTGPGRTAQ